MVCSIPLTIWCQEPVFVDGSELAGMTGTSSNYSASIVDIDEDGLEDIYIGSKLNQPNKMFRNNGDGTFTDIAAALGINSNSTTHAAIWADFDNDGDADCYLGNFNQPNQYYRNDGNGIFIEIAADLGITGDDGNTRCVVTADVNQDGWLDIYVVNVNEQNEFYYGDGQGGFYDYYFPSGASEIRVGLGAIFFDSDNDGDQDLYVTHDAYQANSMFINDGTGHFEERASWLGINNVGQGMGVDVIDFNHDGWLDIYITNFYDGNTLYVNNTDGTYTEISVEAGVDDIGQGWGVSWTDYDHDGHQDLYLANNGAFGGTPNVMYRNNGDSTFTIVGQGTLLDSPSYGSAIATADLNENGKEDIVVCNSLNANSVGTELFWNETETGNNWVGIKLEGTVSNRNALGSIVKVKTGDLVQMDVVFGGSGYSQMNSFRLNFGLAGNTSIDEVEIIWPNGLTEIFTDVEVNQYNSFTEGTGRRIGPSADFNQDHLINMNDLLLLLSGFYGTSETYDLSSNGSVDSVDLLYFLQVYGTEP